MKALPIVIFAIVLVLAVSLSRRNKQRLAANSAGEAAKIGPGTQVMTTSGLYATVIALDGEGAATLSIAPGVHVKWALAALKPVDQLPDTLRPGPNLEKDHFNEDHPPHSEDDPTDTT